MKIEDEEMGTMQVDSCWPSPLCDIRRVKAVSYSTARASTAHGRQRCAL
jgi:hypothetical protein